MPDTDIAVIGAGSAGLAIATLAAALGRRVTIFERAEPGGRHLRESVPAAALAAAARRAALVRDGGRFGIAAADLRIDWNAVNGWRRRAVQELRAESGFARLRAMGVEVVGAPAHFVGRDTVEAAGRRWRFRRCVVATGSQPVIPEGLLGLGDVPYLTTDTVHGLAEAPGHLLVLGGTAEAVALAEAHALLGSLVTLLVPPATVSGGGFLPEHDRDAAALLREALETVGVSVTEGEAVRAGRVDSPETGFGAHGVEVLLSDGRRIGASQLLLAAGRVPHTVTLDLAAAGLSGDARGIHGDRTLRAVGNRRVWVAGSVAGIEGVGRAIGSRAGAAEAHTGQLLRGMLWRLPGGRVSGPAVRPVNTRTALLQVGDTEAEARLRSDKVRVQRIGLADQAGTVVEDAGTGLVKLVVGPGDRLLGATVLAPGAGEMAAGLAAMIGQRVGRLAVLPAPVDALGRAAVRAAVEYHAPLLRQPWLRRWTALASRFP